MYNYPIKKSLIVLIIVTIAIRVAVSFFIFDQSETKLFEYGILAQNLTSGNGYALYVHQNDTIFLADSKQKDALPSAYMMPGYPLLISPFFLGNPESAVLMIFLFHSLLAGIVLVLLYRLSLQLFDKKVAYASVILYALLPEFIYSAATVGPTVVYHIIILAILLILSNLKNTFTKSILLGITFLIGIYLRPETVIFFSIILIVLIFKRYYKVIITVVSIVILGLTPWILRNYLVFYSVIPLTTSAGINLFRGHNIHYPGFWEDAILAEKKLNLARDKSFEISMNKMFLEETVKHIRENSEKNILNIFEKVFHLWGFYSYDARAFNLFYLLPWLVFLYLFFSSFFLRRNLDKNKYIYLYLATATVTAILFFALPRHQTIMKIAMMPIIADGLIYYLRKFKK